MKTYLCISGDSLDQARRYPTKTAAIGAYKAIADEITNYGNQAPEATLHYARNRQQLQEYPDLALSLGPRGGVQFHPT